MDAKDGYLSVSGWKENLKTKTLDFLKEINDRYDLIDRNFQNPHNLILPFTRGGEITRKSLKEDSVDDTSNEINKYNFNY